MTDTDSETLEDVENTSLADVTDDSCVLQLIEIVPLDRPSDDYCKQERIDPVVEVKPEDLQDVKQEPEDNYDIEGPWFTVQVRSCNIFIINDMSMCTCMYNNCKCILIIVAMPLILLPSHATQRKYWYMTSSIFLLHAVIKHAYFSIRFLKEL